MQELCKDHSLHIFDHPVLERGFRPFFLLGAFYSVLNLVIWGGFYAGHITPPAIFDDPVSWHAHEMIYGFTMAIVSGFLLTAVANWTGGAPARQFHLFGLCMLWLIGRVVINVDFGFSNTIILMIEASFIPALALSLAIPLIKNRNKRNFVFLALLGILFFCNLAFFITEERTPLYIAVMVIVTMISLIGGRVIPAFTVAALRRRGEDAFQTPQHKFDIAALISLICIILAIAFTGTQGPILAIAAFISVVIHGLRMRFYHTEKIFNDPMVWILHIGYGWVIMGLFMTGLAALDYTGFSTALHTFTAGAIGSMTLGMMCRVSLGHTGRNIMAGKLTTAGFVFMQIAAVMRIFGPMALPEYSTEWIIGSAALWALCYAIFIIVYAPMLFSPRPDKTI